MAIETQPERAQGAGGGDPLARLSPRPWWRRPAIHTAIIGAVIGYVLGHLLGDYLTGATGSAAQYPNVALSDSEDWPIVLGYLLAIVGWLAGLGVFNDILSQIAGRPTASREPDCPSTRRPAWRGTSGTRSTTRSSASSTWSA